MLYLLGVKAMDALSLTTWRRLSVFIVAGMIACVVATLCTKVVHWNMPLLEEALKALIILYLVCYRQKMAFFAESLVYGMAVGAGFSLVENIMYVVYNEDISLLQCAIRGFGTALVHMGCTALCATILVTVSRIKKTSKVLSFIIALCVAACVHNIYNMFLLPPFIQLLVTVLVFCLLFFVLYEIEERLIARWLDVSISDDVKLLGVIKEGRLDTTRSGQYLIKVKENFHPEVFFDMLVFMQLYLELSIKAKSRLMLREAGLDSALDPVEHERDLERIKELVVLRHNIGMIGYSVLAPLIHVKDTDKWVINELL